MTPAQPPDPAGILPIIQAQVAAEQLRLTQHAQQEMTNEAILLEHLIEAISNGHILENYPDHRRGACCLLYGVDRTGRDLHIVCTTAQPMLIIITAYLPMPPKWISPTQRSERP